MNGLKLWQSLKQNGLTLDVLAHLMENILQFKNQVTVAQTFVIINNFSVFCW